MATTFNTPFMVKPDAGFRLGDIRSIFDAIVSNNANTAAYGITALGTTQATAQQLTSVINQVDTTAASTGVNLPWTQGNRTVPFQMCYVINNGANALKVYAAQGKTDTIDGVAGATGVSQPAGINAIYISAKPGVWERFGLFAAAAANTGTFTATGATEVVISNTNIGANSVVTYGLKTAAGTIAGAPYMSSVTAGTSFGVKAGASDTSVYNYTIIG